MHKKQSLTPSIPLRLEGLSAVVLAVSVVVFLGMSLHTLYQFPVFDGFRWYGDETWSLLGWKNLLAHGRMIVPVALGSQLLTSPGLLLGSPWMAAVIYGLPQLLVHPSTDIVNVGRVVSYILGVGMVLFYGWAAYRLEIKMHVVAFAVALVVLSRSFTLATHSARYDILTGFALLMFVGFLATLLPTFQRNHPIRRWSNAIVCFLIGSVGVIFAFAISPHLEVLLPPIMIYCAWRFGAFRSVKAAITFVSGAVLGSVLILVLYAVPNHSISIASGISSDNQFGSVLSNLPIRHIFSRSAQSHQLWAKGYYLWHEAPLFAFVLPLILLSELTLRITKRAHLATSFVTVCLMLALLVALFVQSTLPYYLIHVLPLAALAFALHLEEWSKLAGSAPVIAVTSLALSTAIWLQSIPELGHAARIGNRIGEANTAAIQAAIEQASRDWEPGGKKPLVLAQGPAIHELLRDTELRVMNESFLFFPIRQPGLGADSPDSVIARAGVDYVIDYHKPMTKEYEAAVRRGEPIFTRIGPLLDRTVDYFNDTTSETDTLTMYQLDATK